MSEVPARPTPEITGHAAPFWAAAREGRLVIQHCPACGQYQHYPRPWCTNCLHEEPEFVDARGEGTIYTFTVIRRSALPAFESGYAAPVLLEWVVRAGSLRTHAGGRPVQRGCRTRTGVASVSRSAGGTAS